MAEPIAGELGLEVLDIEMAGDGSRRLLRIYLDSPDAARSVSLADCEKMSRRMGDVLDAHESVAGRYMLEVSSPGLNRVLRKPAHFERAVGERIRAKVVDAAGKRTLLGRLGGLDGDVIEVVDDAGANHRVSLSEIARANVEFDFEKSGSARGRKGRPKKRTSG